MIHLRPFRGLRPDKKYVTEVPVPPFSNLSNRAAMELLSSNPRSFLHVISPKIGLKDDSRDGDAESFKIGLINLKRMASQGVLVRDSMPCFYVYRFIMGDHVQTGLLGCISCDDYESGIIKKHEKTLQHREKGHVNRMLGLGFHPTPVFLFFHAHKNTFTNIVGTLYK